MKPAVNKRSKIIAILRDGQCFEQEIRSRVRQTLDECMTGGGYCLGSGNSIANYIPVDNYLVMLDEGRRY